MFVLHVERYQHQHPHQHQQLNCEEHDSTIAYTAFIISTRNGAMWNQNWIHFHELYWIHPDVLLLVFMLNLQAFFFFSYGLRREMIQNINSFVHSVGSLWYIVMLVAAYAFHIIIVRRNYWYFSDLMVYSLFMRYKTKYLTYNTQRNVIVERMRLYHTAYD